MNIDIKDLENIIVKNIPSSNEFKRVFHGRGNFYNNFEYLTIDFIDGVLFAAFYKPSQDEELIYNVFKNLFNSNICSCVVIQKRYQKDQQTNILYGTIPEEIYAYEYGLRYRLNLLSNQNIGFFADMKNGRRYIQKISKDKNVLNLFSYTCSFSVASLSVDAKQVVNVDMSKGALNIGRLNHQLNNIDKTKVKFMPYNILKSWSRIRKDGPYDIIIIDPPSFQKGSFAASKDYVKIIKKLDELSFDDTVILAALNAPELDMKFLKDIFKEFAPSFTYIRRLKNPNTFLSNDDQKDLKCLVFKKRVKL